MRMHLFEARSRLPDLLLEPLSSWNAMFIDYETPHVERLWRQMEGYRLYLHRIHPCGKGKKPFLHPHPSPSAVYIEEGSYEMQFGTLNDDGTIALSGLTQILRAGSEYEMLKPTDCHSVNPFLLSSLSIMVTGEPWPLKGEKVRYTHRELDPAKAAVLHHDFKKRYPKI